MTRHYVQIPRRLLAGYRALFRGTFQLLAAALVLLLVSAIISLPVWFFAHTTPVAFDIVMIVAIGAALVWGVVRRVRPGGKKWSFRRLAISTAMIAAPTVVLVLALASHSGVLALAGALLLSGVVAWRVVPS
ncbi:MAG: hypothetical protein PF508_00475 [Spirochaeta sp.]|jgi:hypothetical protein|nr:hypothetical protein [Spirochaeta sp.]